MGVAQLFKKQLKKVKETLNPHFKLSRGVLVDNVSDSRNKIGHTMFLAEVMANRLKK
jgi:hypothetical protein